MIVRGHSGPHRSQQHIKHTPSGGSQTSQLQRENKELKLEVLRLEQRVIEAQKSKKKYKNKYRQAKQKIQILGLLHGKHNNQADPYQLAFRSPKNKLNRVTTHSEVDFMPAPTYEGEEVRGFGSEHSEYGFQLPSKKSLTPTTTVREIERGEDPKVLQQLLRMHQQLQRLTERIEQKPAGMSKEVGRAEEAVYRKMEEVIQKMNKMEMRDLERQKKRAQFEREKANRRCTSAMKGLESIGKGLVDFKVDE